MTMVTETTDGMLDLRIKAEDADKSGVWIDLNNDGIRQPEEGNIAFNNYEGYPIGDNKIITIYGKLSELICQKNNLTQLDVSNNIYLESLMCNNNNIKQLDVSKNKNLTELYCDNNQIQGKNLEDLFNSLPQHQNDKARNIIINGKRFENVDKNSKPTSEQIINANKKGWKVYYIIVDFEVLDYIELKPTDSNAAVINPEEAKKGYITITTAQAGGDIALNINAERTDQADIWIDLNNNGEKDANEINLDLRRDIKISYKKGDTKVVTIYGKVTSLDCSANQITALDVSNNTSLIELRCFANHIQGDNMTALFKGLSERENAKIYVYNQNHPDEKNTPPNQTLMNEAVDKGWVTYFYENGAWKAKATPKPVDDLGARINQEYAKEGYMTMVTARTDGKIKLEIIAQGEQEIRDYFWIDLNNDGKRQVNEDVVFGEYEYTIGNNKIITIYGRVNILDCSANKLTQLDVSKNTQLRILHCINNSFTNKLNVVKTLPKIESVGGGIIEIERSDAITKILKEKNWDYYSGGY